jgi:hypothetical protein
MSDQLTPLTDEPATQPRKARHLMDLSAPRPPASSAAEKRSLTNVQRWVASTLVVSTILHLAFALILATEIITNPQPGAKEMLCVIAGVLSVISVALARLIHGKRPISWWLLLGTLPTFFGLWWIR